MGTVAITSIPVSTSVFAPRDVCCNISVFSCVVIPDIWRGVDGEILFMPIFPVGEIWTAKKGVAVFPLPFATTKDREPPDETMPCWMSDWTGKRRAVEPVGLPTVKADMKDDVVHVVLSTKTFREPLRMTGIS